MDLKDIINYGLLSLVEFIGKTLLIDDKADIGLFDHNKPGSKVMFDWQPDWLHHWQIGAVLNEIAKVGKKIIEEK